MKRIFHLLVAGVVATSLAGCEAQQDEGAVDGATEAVELGAPDTDADTDLDAGTGTDEAAPPEAEATPGVEEEPATTLPESPTE